MPGGGLSRRNCTEGGYLWGIAKLLLDPCYFPGTSPPRYEPFPGSNLVLGIAMGKLSGGNAREEGGGSLGEK